MQLTDSASSLPISSRRAGCGSFWTCRSVCVSVHCDRQLLQQCYSYPEVDTQLGVGTFAANAHIQTSSLSSATTFGMRRTLYLQFMAFSMFPSYSTSHVHYHKGVWTLFRSEEEIQWVSCSILRMHSQTCSPLLQALVCYSMSQLMRLYLDIHSTKQEYVPQRKTSQSSPSIKATFLRQHHCKLIKMPNMRAISTISIYIWLLTQNSH